MRTRDDLINNYVAPTIKMENRRAPPPPPPRRSKPEKITRDALSVDWIIYRGSQIPGPGEYDTTKTVLPNNGRFSEFAPKGYLDDIISRARETPSPSDYALHSKITASGGRFNMSKPKSDLEWTIYRAKTIPGPGANDLPSSTLNTSGGRINSSNPKSDVEWKMYYAARLPGPGQYSVEKAWETPGGRFNLSKPKSEIDWIQYRAKDLPGPGDYRLPPTSKNSGGRFNMSRPKSDIEWQIYRAREIPGPGEYDVDESFHRLEHRSGARLLGRSGPSLPAPFGNRPRHLEWRNTSPDPMSSVNRSNNSNNSRNSLNSTAQSSSSLTRAKLPPRAVSCPPGVSLSQNGMQDEEEVGVGNVVPEEGEEEDSKQQRRKKEQQQLQPMSSSSPSAKKSPTNKSIPGLQPSVAPPHPRIKAGVQSLWQRPPAGSSKSEWAQQLAKMSEEAIEALINAVPAETRERLAQQNEKKEKREKASNNNKSGNAGGGGSSTSLLVRKGSNMSMSSAGGSGAGLDEDELARQQMIYDATLSSLAAIGDSWESHLCIDHKEQVRKRASPRNKNNNNNNDMSSSSVNTSAIVPNEDESALLDKSKNDESAMTVNQYVQKNRNNNKDASRAGEDTVSATTTKPRGQFSIGSSTTNENYLNPARNQTSYPFSSPLLHHPAPLAFRQKTAALRAAHEDMEKKKRRNKPQNGSSPKHQQQQQQQRRQQESAEGEEYEGGEEEDEEDEGGAAAAGATDEYYYENENNNEEGGMEEEQQQQQQAQEEQDWSLPLIAEVLSNWVVNGGNSESSSDQDVQSALAAVINLLLDPVEDWRLAVATYPTLTDSLISITELVPASSSPSTGATSPIKPAVVACAALATMAADERTHSMLRTCNAVPRVIHAALTENLSLEAALALLSSVDISTNLNGDQGSIEAAASLVTSVITGRRQKPVEDVGSAATSSSSALPEDNQTLFDPAFEVSRISAYRVALHLLSDAQATRALVATEAGALMEEVQQQQQEEEEEEVQQQKPKLLSTMVEILRRSASSPPPSVTPSVVERTELIAALRTAAGSCYEGAAVLFEKDILRTVQAVVPCFASSSAIVVGDSSDEAEHAAGIIYHVLQVDESREMIARIGTEFALPTSLSVDQLELLISSLLALCESPRDRVQHLSAASLADLCSISAQCSLLIATNRENGRIVARRLLPVMLSPSLLAAADAVSIVHFAAHAQLDILQSSLNTLLAPSVSSSPLSINNNNNNNNDITATATFTNEISSGLMGAENLVAGQGAQQLFAAMEALIQQYPESVAGKRAAEARNVCLELQHHFFQLRRKFQKPEMEKPPECVTQ